MSQSNMGNVFFYDTERSYLSAFADIFNNKSFNTFTTDNLYQLLRYAKEITPDVMIFNLSDFGSPDAQTLEMLKTLTTGKNFPIIVLQSPLKRRDSHPRIAHYLTMPADYEKLVDIIESYGPGGKTPQIMLLDRYLAQPDPLHLRLRQKGYDFFEVHNADAALNYLQKNRPQNIWIEYIPEFIGLKPLLTHQRVFYVDRHQDIAEIEKFLQ